MQRGSSNLLGILILIGLVTLVGFSPKSPSVGSGTSGTRWSLAPGFSVSDSTSDSYRETTNSSSLISIGTGNASYTYQPYEEYITIENRGRNPINITGWQLRNGKDERTYNYGGNLQRFSADISLIPQGHLYISAREARLPQDIVLGAYERAIVTTGSMGAQTPYKITSFKENICSGYLEALPDYSFTPPLSQNCPRPYEEKGLEGLERDCRDFIRTLSNCETPKFESKTPDKKGYCETCIDGKILSSQCATFIKEHFSYQGCLANHGGDEDFSSNTWRIFLGRGWEMWDKDYESIELYNRAGELVNFMNY